MPKPNDAPVAAPRVLLDEQVIALQPSLAHSVGLEAATFLQQLHFHSVRGTSDRLGRWRTCEDNGEVWVTWSHLGILEDVPLGGAGAAHRRVIGELRELNLLLVKQLEKFRWNRANFFRINYPALTQFLSSNSGKSTETNGKDEMGNSNASTCEIEMLESVDCKASTTVEQASLKIEEKKFKEESKESSPYSISSVETDSMQEAALRIRQRLDALIGKSDRDNQQWDRKRVASTISAIEAGQVAAEEVEALLDRHDVKFLSQVERELRELIQARANQMRRAERVETERRERDRLRLAQEAAALAEEQAQKRLQAADKDEIQAILAHAESRAPIPLIAVRVREAVSERKLGSGMVRAVIMAALNSAKPQANASS